MESGLWALNLCAVVYLCFWAIKMDKKDSEDHKIDKAQIKSENKSEKR